MHVNSLVTKPSEVLIEQTGYNHTNNLGTRLPDSCNAHLNLLCCRLFNWQHIDIISMHCSMFNAYWQHIQLVDDWCFIPPEGCMQQKPLQSATGISSWLFTYSILSLSSSIWSCLACNSLMGHVYVILQLRFCQLSFMYKGNFIIHMLDLERSILYLNTYVTDCNKSIYFCVLIHISYSTIFCVNLHFGSHYNLISSL